MKYNTKTTILLIFSLLFSLELLQASAISRSVPVARVVSRQMSSGKDLKSRAYYAYGKLAPTKVFSDQDIVSLIRLTSDLPDESFGLFVESVDSKIRKQSGNVVPMHVLYDVREEVQCGPINHNISWTPLRILEVGRHEAGHAIVAYELEPKSEIGKISIIPRLDKTSSSGGRCLYFSSLDDASQTVNDHINSIAVAFAGGIAENPKLDGKLIDLFSKKGMGGDLEMASLFADQAYGLKFKQGLLPKVKSEFEDRAKLEHAVELYQIGHDRSQRVLLSRQKELATIGNILAHKQEMYGSEFRDIMKLPQPNRRK